MLLAMTTRYLDRPDGRLAYEETGDPRGPLVIMVPGMGDLRSTFDRLAAHLAADGARAVTTDLRGHGQSSLGWPDYSPAAVADDLVGLAAALGGNAVLVGNSYGGSAAVLAAARHPEAVAGLVLVDSFVRSPQMGLAQRLLMPVLRLPWLGARLWTVAAWPSFFRKRPGDYAERKAELTASLTRPGGFDGLRAMMAPGQHAETTPALGAVRVRALVVMGGADPDFPDPAAEARFTAEALGGGADVLVVEGIGHYPQAEAPEIVGPAVAEFVRKVA
jgi:pimeloyl-ACP methyl ester carboxylesterase